jgi:plastocyanin
MRKLAAACALATLTLAAGCGSDSGSDDAGTPAAAVTSEQADVSSSAAPASSAASDTAAGGSTVLTGTIGTESDPNAFAISLTDSTGAKVTTLPAGEYTIEVHDGSAMHNFHLTGGSVDEKTGVGDVEDTTFQVTLTAGDYTFKCDPHPPMTGTFTVT